MELMISSHQVLIDPFVGESTKPSQKAQVEQLSEHLQEAREQLRFLRRQ
jgi:hypothetical protein